MSRTLLSIAIPLSLLCLGLLLIFTLRPPRQIVHNSNSPLPSSSPEIKFPSHPKQREKNSAASFTVSRGSPSLLGTRSQKLPDSFKLAWTFRCQEALVAQAGIFGDTLFFGSQSGWFFALNRFTGKVLWRFKTGGSIETAPLIRPDSVFFGSADGTIYALNRDSGKLRWKTKTGAQVLSSPNYYLDAKKKGWVLIGSNDHSLYCLDAETGAVRWKYQTENFVNATPAVFADKAIFGGCDGFLHLVKIDNGVGIAKIKIGDPIAGASAVYDNHAYLGQMSNTFLAVDLASKKILWRFTDSTAAIFAPPAVTRQVVVFGSRDRNVYCLERESGKKRWAFTTGGEVDSAPLISQNRVLFGSNDGKLYLLSLKDGRRVWAFEIGAPISASVAVTPRWVYVGAEDGVMYAFAGK